MNNYVITRNTKSYKDAVQATEIIESPVVGFVKPSDYQSIASSNVALLNLQDIQSELRAIREQKGGTSSSPIPNSLIVRLQNLSLGPFEKKKEERGKLRVFKDPYKILKEE